MSPFISPDYIRILLTKPEHGDKTADQLMSEFIERTGDNVLVIKVLLEFGAKPEPKNILTLLERGAVDGLDAILAVHPWGSLGLSSFDAWQKMMDTNKPSASRKAASWLLAQAGLPQSVAFFERAPYFLVPVLIEAFLNREDDKSFDAVLAMSIKKNWAALGDDIRAQKDIYRVLGQHKDPLFATGKLAQALLRAEVQKFGSRAVYEKNTLDAFAQEFFNAAHRHTDAQNVWADELTKPQSPFLNIPELVAWRGQHTLNHALDADIKKAPSTGPRKI